MNAKAGITIGASALAATAMSFGVINWQSGEAEITRKSYNTVTDARGNEISRHSDPAKAFQRALNESMRTGETFFVTPPSYEVTFTNPGVIDLGPIELREAGGVIVIDGIDFVHSTPPPITLEGTHLTTRTVAASGRAQPRVVLMYDTSEPVSLKLWTRAEDPSDPARKTYEIEITPSIRAWP